jgi:hypothetical protein
LKRGEWFAPVEHYAILITTQSTVAIAIASIFMHRNQDQCQGMCKTLGDFKIGRMLLLDLRM